MAIAFEFETPGVRNTDRLRAQLWRYQFIIVAWPAFLLLAPGLTAAVGTWSLVISVPIGVYLFNWLALHLHESWHSYMPGLDNDAFFRWSARMLFLDPQLLRLIHSHHHSRVSTWDDIEVHPFGDIRSRPLRIANSVLELTLGIVWILVGWHVNVPRHEAYRARYSIRTLVVSTAWTVGFLVLLFVATTALFGATPTEIAITWAVSFWLGGMFLHHSSLIQHGNLIVAGDIEERNHWVRGLRPAGPAERIFLILTLQDQVLHHWDPGSYHRAFRNNLRDEPSGAILIDFRDYRTVVADLLAGRATDHTRLGTRTPEST